MAARSTSRFKRKPAVPFGDFMLPILGVIALGIVVMGIRMLWAPSTPKATIIPQNRKVAAKTSTAEPVSQPKKVIETEPVVSKVEETSDLNVVARPVSDKKTASSGSKTSGATAQTKPPKSQSAQPRPAPAPKPQPKAEPQAKPPAPAKTPGLDKSQFVVQCGSFTDKAGADAAAGKLKSIGYNAVIRKADVRGKSYFRVIVPGGSRSQAESVQADIKKKTSFPTLVRANSGD